MNREKELRLEEKYLPVLAYVEASKLLSTSQITSGKIRGAITSFCRAEKYERPTTFEEMEAEFIPDFLDWWWETRPDFHVDLDEAQTREAVKNYLAFTTVWKAKFKNHEIVSNQYRIQASTMLTVKNTLAASLKAQLSYNKRIGKIDQGELRKVFPEIFQALLPVIFSLQSGLVVLPDGNKEDDLTRLIGGFFAKDPAIIDASNKIKQIEYNQDAA
ncbi:MAG: hypothetical protein GY799_13360 [Desulfobulbaceae bacterium]|nr:hypothetical protein [Desulfobulbaceae bacterium]